MRRTLLLAVLLCLGLCAPAQAHFFWLTEAGTAIGRANLDESRINGSWFTAPTGRVLAADDTHLFFGAATSISRVGVDRGDLRQPLISGLQGVSALALSPTHVYWVDAAAQTIGRADRDGGHVERSFLAVPEVAGVAVGSEHLYWTAGNRIGRARLDGTQVESSFIGALGSGADPSALAIDRNVLFWADTARRSIGRAQTDGTDVRVDLIPDVDARSLAVYGDFLFFGRGRQIVRTNIYGTSAVLDVLTTTGDALTAVAVTPATSAWTTTTLTPSAETSVFGDLALTFTAWVRHVYDYGAPVPGAVQFRINGVDDGQPVPLVAGRALYDSSVFLEPGDRVSAHYLGDTLNDPSEAETRPFISSARTELSITTFPDATTAGEDFDVSIRVRNQDTAIPPFGSVWLAIDDEFVDVFDVDDDGVVELVGGADLEPGRHHFSATYGILGYPGPVPAFGSSYGATTHTVRAAPAPAPAVTPTPTPPAARPTPSAPPAAPFTVVRASASSAGAITVVSALPGAGSLSATAGGYGRASKTLASRGRATVVLRPRAATRRKLARGRAVRVTITLRYRPASGGASQTLTRRLTVKRLRAKGSRAPSPGSWRLASRSAGRT